MVAVTSLTAKPLFWPHVPEATARRLLSQRPGLAVSQPQLTQAAAGD